MLPSQVSVLWCFYNTSAPFLLLWHKLFHNKGLTLLVNFWALASSLIVLAIICIIWIILPTEFDYGQVCTTCCPTGLFAVPFAVASVTAAALSA